MEQLITIRNGERVTGTFSAAEMDGRLARLRRQMAESGIGQALFTS